MSTDLERRTPSQELVAQLRDDRVREQLAMALPPSVTVDKFVRVMTAAILTNPDIAKLEQNSIFTAMIKAAAMGLIPDGKEGAIVGRGGKATFVPMVWGFRKIAAEYGWSLRGYAVYEADDFEQADVLSVPVHREARPGVERGPLVAAWAIAKHRDGRLEVRVMYAPDIAKRRAMATTQNVWDKWEAEMWTKTPVRDLFADLPFDEADKRIHNILAAELEPGEAAHQLYGGPAAVTPPVLEAPKTEQVEAPPTSAGDESQAAAEATPPPPAAAPGDPDYSSLDEPEPEVEYASVEQRREIFNRAKACKVDEEGLKAIFEAITGQASSAKIPASTVGEILDALGEPKSAFVAPPGALGEETP